MRPRNGDYIQPTVQGKIHGLARDGVGGIEPENLCAAVRIAGPVVENKETAVLAGQQNVEKSVLIEIHQLRIPAQIRQCANRRPRRTGKGIGSAALIQIQAARPIHPRLPFHVLPGVGGDQIQISVAVHIAQRKAHCGFENRRYIHAFNSAKRIQEAVVQVQPVDFVLQPHVAGDQINIAVAVDIAQGQPPRVLPVRRNIKWQHGSKGIGRSVVQKNSIQSVRCGDNVDAPVAVDIANNNSIGQFVEKFQISRVECHASPRIALIEIDPICGVKGGDREVEAAVAI